METIGRVHSFESCGTVDGPGLRFVIFLQGCTLRCRYCHNPDTWPIGSGRPISVTEMMSEILKYRSYMEASGGGVTVSGGEPLVQAEFVAELFAGCRREGIHTALDTSGHAPLAQAKAVLDLSDLVMLDLKSFYAATFKNVTGVELEQTIEVCNYLSQQNIPAWIRFVLVPGLTDNRREINDMADYLATLTNVKMVDLLPFHKIGEYKWQQLGIKYTLGDTLPPSDENVAQVKAIFEKRGLTVH